MLTCPLRATYSPTTVLISRQHVEGLEVAPVLRCLRSFSASRELAWEYRGSLSIAVDGYVSDPRELFHIPEVCQFFHAVDKVWPYWFFFLTRADKTWNTPALASDQLFIRNQAEIVCIKLATR